MGIIDVRVFFVVCVNILLLIRVFFRVKITLEFNGGFLRSYERGEECFRWIIYVFIKCFFVFTGRRFGIIY